MAKIPLRAYNREIESLIEQGHIDQAIAHCRHTLKSFPKCLDSYRLLGKAYLEARRFPEAEDILRRLLLAVPDDFIGNLGMSIVSDEQKNVNNAIWYMERAFEVQPSNTAVQGELRRLYGRRDGLEPPQIRLTRGALAQMYARGNQTQQAVAEIRSILAEDPDRMDLLVLLARVYFRGGQQVEATDACTDLLKKYPYCLDANRIMVELLSDANRSDSTQIYRHRVNTLDPYSAFVPGSLFDVADVPEQAVLVERLDFDAGEFTSPADFGYQSAEPAAPTPPAEEHEAWKAETGGTGEAPAEELPEAEQAEKIPDWLKAAGWGAATAEAVHEAERRAHEENMVAEPSEEVAEELAQGEVPDWVKSMAPPEAAVTAAAASELSEAQPDEEFLASLGVPQKAEEKAASTQVSMTTAAVAAAAAAAMGQGKEEEKAEAPEAEAEIPTAGIAMAAAAAMGEGMEEEKTEAPAKEAEVPAGIAMAAEVGSEEMKAEAPVEETPVAVEEAAPVMEIGVAELPAAEETPAEELPDWLKGLEIPAQEAAPAEAEEMPDWLAAAIKEQEQPAETAGGGLTAIGAAAAGAAIASAMGGEPEEIAPSEEAQATEDVSAWLAGLDQAEAQPEQPFEMEAPAAEMEIPAEETREEAMTEEVPAMQEKPQEMTPEEISAVQENPEAVTPEQVEEMSAEEAFAWLEALAAKQGANPDELLTVTHEEAEAPAETEAAGPGLGEVLAAGAVAGAMLSHDEEKPQAEPEAEGAAVAPTEDFDWLEGIEEETEAEETIPPMPAVSEWLPEAEAATEAPAVEPAMEEAEAPSEGITAAVMIDAVAQAESEPEAAPAEAEEELPEWLRASMEPAPEATPSEDVPDWIKALVAKPEPSEEPFSLEQPETASEAVVSAETPGLAEMMAGSVIEIARPTPPQSDEASFEQAQIDLQRGNLDEAAAGFSRLIKKGKLLDEIIYDLREATYRYPVDVIIWLTLGDACKRANRLQDALDAYTKAEELLR